MCMYCMVADHTWKYNPPWRPDQYPNWPPGVPEPLNPYLTNPWRLQQLKEYRDLLLQIKDLEDKVGCPCEPKEADYLDLLKKRIELLEKQTAKKWL